MGRPKESAALEVEAMRVARAAEGRACRKCGSEDSMYDHGAPINGICRACSHKEQAEMQKAKYEGQEFNGHLVLSLAREKKTPGNKAVRFWNVRCSTCGLETIREQGNLRKKKCRRCSGKTGAEKKAAEREANPRYHRARYALGQIQSGARARHLSCRLGVDEVQVLIFSPCAYCGIEPPEISAYTSPSVKGLYHGGNGVDRFDSTRGYELGNVVPCCWDCNRAKGTLTAQEFGAWLTRVFKHMGCA